MRSEVEAKPESILARLQVIDRYEFEDFVADVFDIAGWETEVTRDSKDGGVDVIARQYGFIETKALIQAKRPDAGNKVNFEDVTNYYRLKYEEEDTDIVVIVTSAAFTGPAYDYARDRNMKLMDGATLSGFVIARDAFDLLDDYAPPASELNLVADDVFNPDEEARESFFGKRPVEFASTVFDNEGIFNGIDHIQSTEFGGRQVAALDQLRALIDGEVDGTPGRIFVQHPRLFNQNWYEVEVHADVGNKINEEAELSVDPPVDAEVMVVDHKEGILVYILLPINVPTSPREFSYLVDCHDYIADSEEVSKPIRGGCVVGSSTIGLDQRLERLRPYGFDVLTYEDVLERAIRTNSSLLETVRRVAEVSGYNEMHLTIKRLQEYPNLEMGQFH